MNTRIWTWMMAVCSFAAGLPGQSAVLRVKTGAPGPAHDGATWTTAFTTLQAAVDAAAPGDEIWVGAVGETAPVTLKPGLSVYGGFSGDETVRQDRSGLTRMWAADEGAPAVIVPPAAVNVLLDSLMVSGGSPGFLFQAKDTTLNRCLITQCAGGIRCESGAGVRIADTDFGDCTAPEGGGLWSETADVRIERCQLISNKARDGAGPIGSVGGALFAKGGRLTVRDSVFLDNLASTSGGAVYATDALITLVNNTFLTNLASPDYPAQGDGAAVWASSAQPALIANNIFANNSLGLLSAQPFPIPRVPVYISGAVATMAGNLFSANRPEQPVGDDAGGNVWGDATLGPPWPWSEPNMQVLLRPSSLAVNGGREEFLEFGERDYFGNLRTRGVRVDIGAVEADLADAPARVYVRPDGSDGADGRTWATAKRTLQRAVNDAAPGGEVWVAGGVHSYTGPLFMRDRVSLYGGFRGVETDRSRRGAPEYPTTLDAAGLGRVVVIPYNANDVTLDSLTIQRGAAEQGGGVLSQGRNATIFNCRVEWNTAVTGGGIAVTMNSATVERNRIAHNEAFRAERNPSVRGAGILIDGADAVIRENVIAANTAHTVNTTSVPQFGNVSSAQGAGIYAVGGFVTVVGNVIAGNVNAAGVAPMGSTMVDSGSAIAGLAPGLIIANNTIVGNTNASEYTPINYPGVSGGAIKLFDVGGGTRLANNIVAFNSSGVTSDMSRSLLRCNDVFGNTEGNYNPAAPDPTGKDGNISADPLLVDFAGGDYHLRLGSPARDAGDDAYVSDATDLDGLPRIQGVRVDMGAFEARLIPAASMGQALNALWIAGGLTAATPPEADALTDDGAMDLADAVRLLRRASGL